MGVSRDEASDVPVHEDSAQVRYGRKDLVRGSGFKSLDGIEGQTSD